MMCGAFEFIYIENEIETDNGRPMQVHESCRCRYVTIKNEIIAPISTHFFQRGSRKLKKKINYK